MGRRIAVVAKAAEVGAADLGLPGQEDVSRQAPARVLVSQYECALLPWERLAEFRGLHSAFHAEHQPKGATEVSLVDQLVWIEWRRRRLLLGERAAHMASLQERMADDYKTRQTLSRALVAQQGRAEKDELAESLRHAPERDALDMDDANIDERMTQNGVAILEAGGSYDEALSAIRSDTRGWWARVLSDDSENNPDWEATEGESYIPSRPDATSLLRFLKEDVLPVIEATRLQAERRPAIRLQAHGESIDPFRADRILALDERMTRQFGKTLAMLVRLREIRVTGSVAA